MLDVTCTHRCCSLALALGILQPRILQSSHLSRQRCRCCCHLTNTPRPNRPHTHTHLAQDPTGGEPLPPGSCELRNQATVNEGNSVILLAEGANIKTIAGAVLCMLRSASRPAG